MNRRFKACLLASTIFVIALLPLQVLYTPDDVPRKIADTFTALGVSIAWACTGFSFNERITVPLVDVLGNILNILIYSGLSYVFLSAATRIARRLKRFFNRDEGPDFLHSAT